MTDRSERSPGGVARLYHTGEQLDPDGDAELAALHADFSSAPARVTRYAELVNRPYYRVTLARGADLRGGPLRLAYERPLWQFDAERDRAVPFDTERVAAPSVLFLEPLLVPHVAGTVEQYAPRGGRPTAASGELLFQPAPDTDGVLA